MVQLTLHLVSGAAEAGVTGVARNTQYLAAFFHKLSGEKKIFEIGQNLTKLEEKSLKSEVILRTKQTNNAIKQGCVKVMLYL